MSGGAAAVISAAGGPRQPIKWWAKLVYAGPAFALAAAAIFHVSWQTKYYVDDLGLGPRLFALSNAIVCLRGERRARGGRRAGPPRAPGPPPPRARSPPSPLCAGALRGPVRLPLFRLAVGQPLRGQLVAGGARAAAAAAARQRAPRRAVALPALRRAGAAAERAAGVVLRHGHHLQRRPADADVLCARHRGDVGLRRAGARHCVSSCACVNSPRAAAQELALSSSVSLSHTHTSPRRRPSSATCTCWRRWA